MSESHGVKVRVFVIRLIELCPSPGLTNHDRGGRAFHKLHPVTSPVRETGRPIEVDPHLRDLERLVKEDLSVALRSRRGKVGNTADDGIVDFLFASNEHAMLLVADNLVVVLESQDHKELEPLIGPRAKLDALLTGDHEELHALNTQRLTELNRVKIELRNSQSEAFRIRILIPDHTCRGTVQGQSKKMSRPPWSPSALAFDTVPMIGAFDPPGSPESGSVPCCS